MAFGWLIGTQKYPSLMLLSTALLDFSGPSTLLAERESKGVNVAEPRYRTREKKRPQGNG